VLLAALVSAASAGDIFAVCPAGPPNLFTPANNSTVGFGPAILLDWDSVPNATSYEVFIGLDTPVLTSHGSTSATQKAIGVDPGRTVKWKIVANAPSCTPQPSAEFTFTTTCPVAVPILNDPNRGSRFAVGEPITFNWTSVPGAAGYDVKVTPDFAATWIVIAANLVTTSFTTDDLAVGDWGWEVRANFNGACAPAYSEPSQFYVTNCTAGVPQLIAPADNASTAQPVTFQWTAAGAEKYGLFVQRAGGLPRLLRTTGGTSAVVNDLAAGTYEWWAVSMNDACPDVTSSKRTITITSTCNTSSPSTIAPANNATNLASPVKFEWSSVPGAEKYRLFVSIDAGPVSALETTTSTQATARLEGSAIVWAVQALFPNNCPPTISSESRFTLASNGCPANPAKATLVSPAAGATGLASPVTFTWNAVPNAIGYRLLTIMGDDDLVPTFVTTPTATLDLPAGTGSWAVQTLFGEGCASTLSDRRSFTVAQGASCNNAAPQLVSPQNNAGNVPSPVLFKWTDVPRAVAYSLFLSTEETGDNNFVLYGRTGGDTTELEKFVPGDVVRWFVVAHFSGCPDTRSAVFRFGLSGNCPANGSVSLDGPANGAQVSSPVSLSWHSTPPAAEYRVSIENEAGATLLVKRTNTTSDSFRLPVGKFFWRVETLGDCPLASERRSFTVTEGANCANNTAPALVSPVGTETQPAAAQSPVTLRWNPVGNAIAYRVFIARDGQPFEDSLLTSATEKELDLGAGRYRWFVNAIFEGCPSVPSAIAWFVIARAGCVTEVPVILAPDSDEVVTSPVTFLWSEVSGAKKYRLILIVDGEPIVLGTTTDTSLTRILPPGEYAFTIETEIEECPSTRAPLTHFTVARSQNCATEAPDLVSPPDGAKGSDQEIDFVWSPVSGAIRYAVIARLGVGAETTLGTTEDSHLLRNVPVGLITWHVVAFFPGCDPATSEESRFTVERPQNCADRKPGLVFPRTDDEVPSPVAFEIVRVPKATEHRIWIQEGDEPPSIISTTPGEKIDLPPGTYRWFAEARFANCPPTFSARVEFTATEPVPCDTPLKPDAQVIGQALSGSQYRVRWTPLPNVSRFEVQESTSLDFANATTSIVDDLSRAYRHEVSGAPVQYLYRVRGLSDCDDSAGPFSDVVGVFVVEARTSNSSTELGEEGSVVQTLFLPGGTTPRQFTATTDKPWLKVSPSGGTLPVEGLTLTVTADPGVLVAGTNTGTVQVQYSGGSGGGISTNDASSSTFPMSVSLVTPVTPSGKGTPPPDALIFAAVGHAAGVNGSLFETDIRLTNLTAQTMTYDLNFTPSGVNGTETGFSSTVEIAPNATLALDDIVATLFGSGTTSSSLGMLEVRPVSTTPPATGFFGSVITSGIRELNTAASSRTYNFTPNGTFGQFIPATRFSDFVGRDSILSLQQVAQSTKFRANFGFLEASGNSADLLVRVYDSGNTLLATIPVSLAPMQHRQLNGLLQQNGINDLDDGRVEVEVIGGDGKVTAYVSEVDNATNDPLLVSAVVKGAVRADRYIVPGMAYINTGSAFWVSDLRVFNSGTTATPATLTFVPQGNPGATITREITIEPGEIELLNNVVGDLFAQPNGAGGAIIITTPDETSLTATARTYNQTATGTYGQYIAGVTAADSIAKDDRALQILQVEQSTRFRTNIGLSETTGKGATVEISLITPDSLVTQVVTIGLAPNEFRQIGLVDFHAEGAVYNGRVTVKVIDGDGRVTAYGSAIDQITQDPTYVPAL
jgi:hypothetical protein